MKLIRYSWKKCIIVLVIIFGFLLVHIAQAVTSQQLGTNADSSVSQNYVLVTQDYVDEKINELTAKINELMIKINELTVKNDEMMVKNNELVVKNNELAAKDSEFSTKIDELTSGANNINQQMQGLQAQIVKFEALEIKAGKQLLTGAGAEIIIRGGKAKGIAGKKGGLSDITSGSAVDIKTDENLPLNHMLIASRDDGRGVKAVTDIWVLVKGMYTIQ